LTKDIDSGKQARKLRYLEETFGGVKSPLGSRFNLILIISAPDTWQV
jgi:hypothetical protein